MSNNYNTYEFIEFNNLNNVLFDKPYVGRIYNLYLKTHNSIENLTNAIVYNRHDVQTVLCARTYDNINGPIIGAYFNPNVLYDDLAAQYIINIEEGSELDEFIRLHTTPLIQTDILSKKYMIPINPKPFLSYNYFNPKLEKTEKFISCLVDFKLKGYRYRGFEFLYRVNEIEPEKIILYREDDNNFSYTPTSFIQEFGGEKIEILQSIKVWENLGNWFNNYMEEWVDPETTIDCYRYGKQFNKVDKTDDLIFVTSIKGIPRDSFSLTHPTFAFELNTVPDFNYVYIDELNRYYFVESITFLRYNLYLISLKVDVLMTYRRGIKNLDAFVDRNQFTYNENIVDKKRVYEQGVSIEQIDVDNVNSEVIWLQDYEDKYMQDPESVYDDFFVICGYKVKALPLV